jgi:hypothetical protein
MQQGVSMRLTSHLLAALALTCLTACQTQVMLTPKLSTTPPQSCVIAAPLSYEGKPDYVPQVLSGKPAGGDLTILRYTYNTDYNADQQITVAQVFNPLLIAGFPTGSNAITVSGLLEVVRDGKPVRAYAAACALKRSSNVFSEGETMTELRRRGLMLVRDNISAQICQDQQGLRALLVANPPTNEDKQLQ